MILYSVDFQTDEGELDTAFVEASNVLDAVEIWKTHAKLGVERVQTIDLVASDGVVRRSRLKASA